MIAQLILSALLGGILLYAWTEYRRSPAVAVLAVVVASAGIYLVWVPEHSTQLAELVGIGRGVDLILYIWVCISLIVLLNLHLKLRTQMELITALARKIAIAEVQSPERVEWGCFALLSFRRKRRLWVPAFAGTTVVKTASDTVVSLIVGPPRIGPGERASEALDFVDQDDGLAVSAMPSLRGDNEVGLVRIGFDDPWFLQHRADRPFTP